MEPRYLLMWLLYDVETKKKEYLDEYPKDRAFTPTQRLYRICLDLPMDVVGEYTVSQRAHEEEATRKEKDPDMPMAVYLAQQIFLHGPTIVPPKSFGPEIGGLRGSHGYLEDGVRTNLHRVTIGLPNHGDFEIIVMKVPWR